MKKGILLTALVILCVSMTAFSDDGFFVIPTVKTETVTVTKTVTQTITMRTQLFYASAGEDSEWRVLDYSTFPTYSHGVAKYTSASVVAADDNKQGVKLRYYYVISDDGEDISIHVWQDDQDNLPIHVRVYFMLISETTS